MGNATMPPYCDSKHSQLHHHRIHVSSESSTLIQNRRDLMLGSRSPARLQGAAVTPPLTYPWGPHEFRVRPTLWDLCAYEGRRYRSLLQYRGGTSPLMLLYRPNSYFTSTHVSTFRGHPLSKSTKNTYLNYFLCPLTLIFLFYLFYIFNMSNVRGVSMCYT